MNDKRVVKNYKKVVENYKKVVKNDKKVVRTYTMKEDSLKAVDDHESVQHEAKAKIPTMKIIECCKDWCCHAHCVFIKHGKVGQFNLSDELYKEHLFPALLEFEEYRVELCGDELFVYAKKLLFTLFAVLNTVLCLHEYDKLLFTLFAELNTVLGLHEIDKLVLTHCAVNTILPALTVLNLYELDVEQFLLASADTFLVQ